MGMRWKIKTGVYRSVKWDATQEAERLAALDDRTRTWLGKRSMIKPCTTDPICPVRRWGNHPDKSVRELARLQSEALHEAHGPCRPEKSGRGVRTKGWLNWHEDAEAAQRAMDR